MEERYIFPSNIPQQSPNIRPDFSRYSAEPKLWECGGIHHQGTLPRVPTFSFERTDPQKFVEDFSMKDPKGDHELPLSVARNDNTMASLDVIYQDRGSPKSEDCRKLN